MLDENDLSVLCYDVKQLVTEYGFTAVDTALKQRRHELVAEFGEPETKNENLQNMSE